MNTSCDTPSSNVSSRALHISAYPNRHSTRSTTSFIILVILLFSILSILLNCIFLLYLLYAAVIWCRIAHASKIVSVSYMCQPTRFDQHPELLEEYPDSAFHSFSSTVLVLDVRLHFCCHGLCQKEE